MCQNGCEKNAYMNERNSTELSTANLRGVHKGRKLGHHVPSLVIHAVDQEPARTCMTRLNNEN